MRVGHLHAFMDGYAASDALRLHTPGHKGKLIATDITELDGVFPDTQLKAAERFVASAYGAKNARLLAGGSSQGVKSAVLYAASDGIVDVNSHRSVFDGFALSGKRATAVGRKGDIRPITVKDIDGAMTDNIGCVVVTSPTYFGYAADIDGISEYCKRKGLLFIIDGAHGAHYGFSPHLPLRFSDKCDICNVSAHKTLGALTQSAVLLDNLGDANALKLRNFTDVMGTTSPSYLLYASTEDAVLAACGHGEKYAELKSATEHMRREFPFLENDDFTRLVLDCGALGGGQAFNKKLQSVGVYAELVTNRYVVFLFTAADGAAQAERLNEALRDCIRESI